MFKPPGAYRKAEPQAPVYSNVLNSNSYSNAPSYANIGNPCTVYKDLVINILCIKF